MKLVVTDANIFIDLVEMHLLASFFELKFEFFTTWEVLQELDEHDFQELLIAEKYKWITIHSFLPSEVPSVNQPDVSKGLSYTDRSVLFLAEKIKGMLITGDNLLRKEAPKRNIEAHGILWVMEQLILQKILTPEAAIAKLRQLMTINLWLPAKLCQQKLDEWKAMTV
ncbi:MAG: hypothetical protein H6581_02840 [Bacteroidia bacterium]|nr:hypothetical protein [Bacteroidia bacterium]